MEELRSQSQCGGSPGWTASPRHETIATSQVSATQLTFSYSRGLCVDPGVGAEAAGTDLLPVRSMPPDGRLPPKVAEGHLRLVHNFGIPKLLCGLSTPELSVEKANFHSPALSLDRLLSLSLFFLI